MRTLACVMLFVSAVIFPAGAGLTAEATSADGCIVRVRATGKSRTDPNRRADSVPAMERARENAREEAMRRVKLPRGYRIDRVLSEKFDTHPAKPLDGYAQFEYSYTISAKIRIVPEEGAVIAEEDRCNPVASSPASITGENQVNEFMYSQLRSRIGEAGAAFALLSNVDYLPGTSNKTMVLFLRNANITVVADKSNGKIRRVLRGKRPQ